MSRKVLSSNGLEPILIMNVNVKALIVSTAPFIVLKLIILALV